MSARPPMPTIWLKPTPFGSAQSSTARHSDADCETSPIRPAGGDQMRARGIQPDGGHGDAERARPQHTNPAAERRVGQAVRVADDHGRECAFGSQRPQDLWRWRGGDDGQVGG